MGDQEPQKNYLRELVFIFFSQFRVVAITAAVVAAAVLAVAIFAPPRYMATGAFLIKGKKAENSPGALEKAELRVMPVSKEDLFSEVEILISVEVLQEAARELLEGKVVPIGPAQAGFERTALEKELRGEIASRLKTEVVPSSNVIQANLTWSDPEIARRILGAVMRHYLSYRRAVFNPVEMGEFFSDQVNNYLTALKEKQDRLLQLVNLKRAPDAKLEIQNNLALRAKIDEQLHALESERIDLGVQVGQIEDRLASNRVQYFSFVGNQVVRDLASRLQELVIQQSHVHKTYLPGTAPAQEIDAQVGMIMGELRDEMAAYLDDQRNNLKSLDARIEMLEARRTEIDRRNMDLKELDVAAERIQQETALLSFSFETFYKRREEAVLARGEDAAGLHSQVVILHQAKASDEPVFPNRVRLIPIGFVVAIMTGISVGFLAHFFDSTIKRPEDLEETLGTPVLFSIADAGSGKADGGALPRAGSAAMARLGAAARSRAGIASIGTAAAALVLAAWLGPELAGEVVSRLSTAAPAAAPASPRVEIAIQAPDRAAAPVPGAGAPVPAVVETRPAAPLASEGAPSPARSSPAAPVIAESRGITAEPARPAAATGPRPVPPAARASADGDRRTPDRATRIITMDAGRPSASVRVADREQRKVSPRRLVPEHRPEAGSAESPRPDAPLALPPRAEGIEVPVPYPWQPPRADSGEPGPAVQKDDHG